MKKKDFLLASMIILIFGLIGKVLISLLEKDEMLFILIFEFFPIFSVTLLYLYRQYSFKKNWELLVLALINIVFPLYWFIIFNSYNCFSIAMLKYSSEVLNALTLFYMLLFIFVISKQSKEKKDNTEKNTGGGYVE